VSSFKNRPLRVLDTIYQFIGGMTGLTRFSLKSGIQPVHDVSRESELAGFGNRQGFWLSQGRQAHVAAGSQSDRIVVYNNTALNNNSGWQAPLPPDLRIWILGGFGTISGTDANFAEAGISFEWPGQSVGPADTTPAQVEQLVFHSTSLTNLGAPSALIPTAGLMDRPFRMDFDTTQALDLVFRSRQTGAGAVTVQLSCIMWVGKTGTAPPGMA